MFGVLLSKYGVHRGVLIMAATTAALIVTISAATTFYILNEKAGIDVGRAESQAAFEDYNVLAAEYSTLVNGVLSYIAEEHESGEGVEERVVEPLNDFLSKLNEQLEIKPFALQIASAEELATLDELLNNLQAQYSAVQGLTNIFVTGRGKTVYLPRSLTGQVTDVDIPSGSVSRYSFLQALRRFEGWFSSELSGLASYYELLGSRQTERASEQLYLAQNLAFYTTVAVVLLVLGVFVYFVYLLAHRIFRFSNFISNTVKSENYGAQYPSTIKDEVGDLIDCFNQFSKLVWDYNRDMDNQVKQRTQTIEEQNKLLEQALHNLKTSQQKAVEQEKLAILGRLVANIAHEVNTPAAAIHSVANSFDADFQELLGSLIEFSAKANRDQLDAFKAIAVRFLDDPLLELSTREQRIISDRLSKSLSKFCDVSAIDVRGIVFAGINDGYAEDLAQLFGQDGKNKSAEKLVVMLGMLRIHVRNMKVAISRIVNLVNALKSATRPDGEHLEFKRISVKDGIEDSLIILSSKIKRGVNVSRQYDDLPDVLADGSKLGQVWTIIIDNALHAMNYSGSLNIRTFKRSGNDLAIQIEDTGEGIPASSLKEIFKPYYTTKKKGEGTGLGLSMVKQIVREHKGRVLVISRPGRTIFEVILPCVSDDRRRKTDVTLVESSSNSKERHAIN